jgi:hypothetical protein
VTLSGYAESPKVADTMIEALHFSGIKFAVGLAKETDNPLRSHEIRRKRTRRQNFYLDAQEENHPFSHCHVWVILGHTFLHSCGAALCMLSAHAINPGSAGVLSLLAD